MIHVGQQGDVELLHVDCGNMLKLKDKLILLMRFAGGKKVDMSTLPACNWKLIYATCTNFKQAYFACTHDLILGLTS